jgi:hypothetical protein
MQHRTRAFRSLPRWLGKLRWLGRSRGTRAAQAELERQRYFSAYNAAYAALREDPAAWAEEMEDQKVWDGTLADGLEPEPRE